MIRKLCRGDPKALQAFDEATTKKPGGNNNPEGTNQHTKPNEAKLAISKVDLPLPRSRPSYPTGTTAQNGIRRLRKAADRGEDKAADLLRQVLGHSMTIHAANVAMGWRKSTITLVDTPERVAGFRPPVGLWGDRSSIRHRFGARRIQIWMRLEWLRSLRRLWLA